MPRHQGAPAECVFCRILRGEVASYIVFEDEISVAFLDHRPLARGHCLLIPRRHHDTLLELPAGQAGPLLQNVQLLMRALERGLSAHGAFLAVNVRISQSVPHLHFHVIPRWRKDGLFSRPFFWFRRPRSAQAMQETQAAIRAALAEPSSAQEPPGPAT